MGTVNLAWFSDIHVQQAYLNGPNCEWLKTQCNATIDFLQKKYGDTLHYLLLNGDIAYHGKREEYELFNDYFLEPIRNSFKGINVLSVPGNHDINWESAGFLAESITTDMAPYQARLSLMNRSIEPFIKSFYDYSDFVSKNDINNMAGNMDERKLFGYQVDVVNKIVFILLNSAWFSIGSHFDKLILDYCGTDDAMTALKIKGSIAEFGNQMISNDMIYEFFFGNKKGPDPFDSYSDYTFITMMHHPLHWLSFNEVYGLTQEKSDNIALHKILEGSNFLLTGHEHLPMHVPKQRIFGKVNNLRAGCYLEKVDTSKYIDHYEYNRFSVLCINKHKFSSYAEHKYTIKYSTDNRNGRTKKMVSIQDSNENVMDTPYYDRILAPPNPIAVNNFVDANKIQAIKKAICADNIKKNKRGYYFHEPSIENKLVDIFLFENNSPVNVDDITIDMPDGTINNSLIDKIDELVIDELCRAGREKWKVSINIIGYDYNDDDYVQAIHDIISSDMSCETEDSRIRARLDQYNLYLKKKHIKFNKFKHDYFIRIENSEPVKSVPLKLTLELLSNVRIVLRLMKYWEL